MKKFFYFWLAIIFFRTVPAWAEVSQRVDPLKIKDRVSYGAAAQFQYDDNILLEEGVEEPTVDDFILSVLPDLSLEFPEEDSYFAFFYNGSFDYYFDFSEFTHSQSVLTRGFISHEDKYNVGGRVRYNFASESRIRKALADRLLNAGFWSIDVVPAVGVQVTDEFALSSEHDYYHLEVSDETASRFIDQDRNELKFLAHYDLFPKWTLGGGYTFRDVDFLKADSKDQTSHIPLSQMTLRFPSLFDIEFDLGYEFKEILNVRDDEEVYFSTKVASTFSRYMEVALGYVRGLESSNRSEFAQYLNQTIFFDYTNYITPQLIFIFGVEYGILDFDSADRVLASDEAGLDLGVEIVTVNVGFRRILDERWSMGVGYTFEKRFSDFEEDSYTVNRAQLSVSERY